MKDDKADWGKIREFWIPIQSEARAKEVRLTIVDDFSMTKIKNLFAH
jgi:hypothetical protein